MKTFDYTKAVRLRKRSEFIYTSTFGRKVQNGQFIAYFISNNHAAPRLGVTATKRVGKAVTRNSIKRRAREYFRIHRKDLCRCIDINVIAKKESAKLASEEIFSSLDNLFDKIKRDGDH